VLYEFAGPGAPKALYKVVSIGGKREVDEALRGVRGEKWSPDEAVATTGPSATPAVAAQVAARRDWTVTVVVVRKPNAAVWDKQFELENVRLRQLDQIATQKRMYANQTGNRGQARVVVTRDVFGNQVRRSAPPTALEATAVAEAERAEEERKKQNGNVLRMQRERLAGDTARTVVGRLEDGSIINLEMDGAAMTTAADTCEVGSRWEVNGIGRVVDGELRVRPKSITAARAATKPSE
jgi:hypothetical protein